MAHGCDWFATLAELCNLKFEHRIDGKSIVPIIKSGDADSPHDSLAWKAGEHAAWRSGPWKLLRKPVPSRGAPPLAAGDREWFLANVETDPGETINQKDNEPDIFEKLKSELQAAME